MGRPTKGPTVSVSLRLSKDLADRISALRKKVERDPVPYIDRALTPVEDSETGLAAVKKTLAEAAD